MKIKYLLYSVLTATALSGCSDVLNKKIYQLSQKKMFGTTPNTPLLILTNYIVTTFPDGMHTLPDIRTKRMAKPAFYMGNLLQTQ